MRDDDNGTTFAPQIFPADKVLDSIFPEPQPLRHSLAHLWGHALRMPHTAFPEPVMSIDTIALVLLLGLASTTGRAQTAAHPAAATRRPAQAEAADAMVDTLTNWTAVDGFFKAYRQCDDGGIAEGSADAIAQLLAKHWRSLPQLQTLIEREPALGPFVLNHINATLDTGTLDRIRHNAATACPAGAAMLCADIRHAAEQALK